MAATIATTSDLQKTDTIFQIGVAARRIDIITGASGLRFDETYARSIETDVEGLTINITSLGDLIKANSPRYQVVKM